MINTKINIYIKQFMNLIRQNTHFKNIKLYNFQIDMYEIDQYELFLCINN